MKIITNNQKRPLVCGWELTEKEYRDFDYLGEYGSDDMAMVQFIRYKGELYYLGDFVRIEKPGQRTNSFTHTDYSGELAGWAGIMTDTFFSGIVIKWAEDDCVIVGRVSV